METKNNNILITAEMEKTFIARMQLHRLLVKKNLLMLQGYLGLSYDLLQRVAMVHDASKYKEPERKAYIWMTWMYHCQNNDMDFKYPDGIETVVQQGWQHHIGNNSHHPEAHEYFDLMTDLDVVEMVCDWTAISQEQNLGNNSCMSWATENIDKKWNFSFAKKKFIFATIQELDKRNQTLASNLREHYIETIR